MNTFSLNITTCDRVFYKGECEVLTFPTTDGEMAILANHEQMTTVVEIGELRFRSPDQKEHVAIISDGFLKVKNNEVTILVYSAETPEEIDEARAREAATRAREQLQRKQSIMEYHVSTTSLARAMARLNGKDKYLSN